jgi:AcrR family transcriptional regulator
MIAAVTSRGPYAGTSKRRQQIVEAALDAFALGGFRGSSLKEISEAVGMSNAGLLHHFSSKEELLLEVLNLREEANFPPDDVHGLDVLNHLRKVVQVDSVTQGVVQLFITVSAEATNPSHPAHDYFVSRYQRGTAEVGRRLQEARDEGKLRADLNPELVARQLLAVLDGLLLQSLLNPDIDRLFEFDRYLEQFLTFFSIDENVRTVDQLTGESAVAS